MLTFKSTNQIVSQSCSTASSLFLHPQRIVCECVSIFHEPWEGMWPWREGSRPTRWQGCVENRCLVESPQFHDLMWHDGKDFDMWRVLGVCSRAVWSQWSFKVFPVFKGQLVSLIFHHSTISRFDSRCLVRIFLYTELHFPNFTSWFSRRNAFYFLLHLIHSHFDSSGTADALPPLHIAHSLLWALTDGKWRGTELMRASESMRGWLKGT